MERDEESPVFIAGRAGELRGILRRAMPLSATQPPPGRRRLWMTVQTSLVGAFSVAGIARAVILRRLRAFSETPSVYAGLLAQSCPIIRLRHLASHEGEKALDFESFFFVSRGRNACPK